jgi:hypothetical protein
MNARIIDFQGVPRDEEAVAYVAAEALRRSLSDRELLLEIDAGSTPWQQKVDRELAELRLDLRGLIEHCKGRTVACNQFATIPPPPGCDGDSRRRFMRRLATSVFLLSVAFTAMVLLLPAHAFAMAAQAVGAVDPSVTQVQLIIVGMVNSVTTALASYFGNADNGGPAIRPKLRLLILFGLSIVIGVCTGVLQQGATIPAAILVGLTSNIGGFVLTILEAIAEAKMAALTLAAKAAAPLAIVLCLGVGCAGPLHQIEVTVQEVNSYLQDAQLRVTEIHSAVDKIIAVVPGIPDDALDKINKSLDALDMTLAAVIKASGNIEKIASEAWLLDNFGGFMSAWNDVMTILRTFGVLGHPRVAAIGAGSVHEPVVFVRLRTAKVGAR